MSLFQTRGRKKQKNNVFLNQQLFARLYCAGAEQLHSQDLPTTKQFNNSAKPTLPSLVVQSSPG